MKNINFIIKIRPLVRKYLSFLLQSTIFRLLKILKFNISIVYTCYKFINFLGNCMFTVCVRIMTMVCSCGKAVHSWRIMDCFNNSIEMHSRKNQESESLRKNTLLYTLPTPNDISFSDKFGKLLGFLKASCIVCDFFLLFLMLSIHRNLVYRQE